MIEVALVSIMLFMMIGLIMLIKSKDPFSKVLFLGVLSSMIAAEIALFAVYSNQSMYIDIAITMVILGFMDVQFYAVYLRRKGDI